MRIAVLSAGDGWHVRDLQRAAARRHHEAVAVDFRRNHPSCADEGPFCKEATFMSPSRFLAVLVPALFLGACVHLARSEAPAPQQGRGAKEKFETLKKKLPAVAARWLKESYDGEGTLEPEVKLARMIAPAKAKFTFRFKATLHGQRAPEFDFLLSVYLCYYDGRWTTTGCSDLKGCTLDTDLLLLAIDQADEE